MCGDESSLDSGGKMRNYGLPHHRYISFTKIMHFTINNITIIYIENQ